jgi:glycosyltransferase involved in cell wall biosynthesis
VLRGYDIVCVSSLDWTAHWTSKQQIMHRLAAANRVLYVEEPVTMLAPLKVPERWSRWRACVPTLAKREADLWTLTPPPLLPFGNVRREVNRVNQFLLARYVDWAVARLGLSDYLFWTYLPTSVALLDHLWPRASRSEARGGPVAAIYHCVDEHSAFPGFVNPGIVQAYDAELTARADLVVCTAEALRRSREGLNSRLHHVPNAADVTHFRRALDPGLEVPMDLARIPHPRVGVIGVHDERLDVDALVALAEALPALQVVLVGPVRPGDVDEARLRSYPNIHLVGGKPVAQLPAYLKGLDVALIPYRLNELSRNIFPLKLFEYLAGGKPVVSAALPELERFRGTIRLAALPAEYPKLVREALAEDSPKHVQGRVALAEKNTWDQRVEEISDLVEAMLEEKRYQTGHGMNSASATGRGGTSEPAMTGRPGRGGTAETGRRADTGDTGRTGGPAESSGECLS